MLLMVAKISGIELGTFGTPPPNIKEHAGLWTRGGQRAVPSVLGGGLTYSVVSWCRGGTHGSVPARPVLGNVQLGVDVLQVPVEAVAL